jgi:tRNA-guanine family transglycosylase
MGVFANFISGAQSGSIPAGNVDHLLVSVPNVGHNDRAILRTLKFFKSMGPGTMIAQDSGGFQLFQAEHGQDKKVIIFDPTKPIDYENCLNLTPRHIVETALKLEPDIMISLDMPIPKEVNKGRQNILFMKNNTFNVRCAKDIAAARDKLCPHIRFFIPVQAYDLDQFEYFVKDIGNINYDGLSLPNRLFTTEKIAFFLTQFHRMGIRQAHVLGTTRFDILATLAYFARNHFDFLSVDATSWMKFANVQVYLRPFSLKELRLNDEAVIADSDINVCECPWCERRSFYDIKNMINADKTMFLKAHNVWVTEQAMKEFYAHAETPASLKDFLMGKTGRIAEVNRIFKCLSTLHSIKNILSDDYLKVLFKKMCEQ